MTSPICTCKGLSYYGKPTTANFDHDAGCPCESQLLGQSVAQLKAEILRLHEREQHFARVLGVPDGGRYRNDWDSRLTQIQAERDDYRTALRDIADRHPENNASDPDWAADLAYQVLQSHAALLEHTEASDV